MLKQLTFAAMLAAAPAGAETLFGGKLLLTNGVSSIEGAAGGGLATWAVIAGNATDAGWGGKAHATLVSLPDYELRSYGAALGIRDRLELSFTRQDFDTGKTGAALGIGRGYTFNQDIFAAKVRVAGDVVYDSLPAIALGVQAKRNHDGAIVRAVGAHDNDSVDYTLSATRLFLAPSLLLNATLRLTEGNQFGLLGFDDDYSLQFETSAALQISRRLVVGGEYRSKPDKLAFARERDAFDLFAAYALTQNFSVTAAYVDLGPIATFKGQDGLFLSLQGSF